jgi:serine/threonine protein kinase
MIYLHSKGLVHRDLKPGNLLVSSLPSSPPLLSSFLLWFPLIFSFKINSLAIDDVVSCVITDFGITKEQSPLMTAGQGTPVYSAPEVFSGKRDLHYSRKVDVFSFGIILWEIWLRRIPFQDLTEPVVDVIGRGERPPISIHDNIPLEYVNLMKNCWSQAPEDRPLFEEVLQKLEEEIEKLGSVTDEPISKYGLGSSGSGSGSVSGPATGVTTSWVDSRYQDTNTSVLSAHRRSMFNLPASTLASSITSSGNLHPSSATSSGSGVSLGTHSGSGIELVTGGVASLAISGSGSGSSLGDSIASRSKVDLAVEDAKVIPVSCQEKNEKEKVRGS